MVLSTPIFSGKFDPTQLAALSTVATEAEPGRYINFVLVLEDRRLWLAATRWVAMTV